MTQAHKDTILPIKNRVLSVDKECAFLAHMDLGPQDVLRGVEPIGESSAALFDTTYIKAKGSQYEITTSLTMTAWVCPTAAPFGDRGALIIGKGPGGGYYFTIDTSYRLSAYWHGKTPAGYHNSVGTCPLNKWSHVAVVWNATELKMYINGVLDTTIAASGAGVVVPALDIGAENVTNRYFKGKINDLGIWATEKSAEDIQHIMNKGKIGQEKELRAFWKMNEAKDNVLRDSSVFHNDITHEPNKGFTWSSSQQCFTLRPKEGVFGGGAIAIEEETTNLIINPSFLTTSNWGFATSGTGTLSTDGRWAKMGVTTGETNVYHFAYQDIARVTPANKPIAFSVTFKNNTSGRFALRLVMFEATAAVQQPMTEVVLDGTGIPKRYTVVGVHTANSSSLRFDILSGSYYSSYGGLSDVDLEFNDLQAEEKAFPTSFVNGTRPAGLLRYPNPIYGEEEGTINFWVKFPNTTSILTSQVWFWDYDGTTVTEWFGISNSGGVYKLSNFGNVDASIYQDSWHMYTIVKNSGNVLRTYIDGDFIGTKSGSSVTNMFKSSMNISIGSHSTGAYPANILMDELRIDKIARTDEEILAWYQSNSPFSPRGMYRKSY